MSLVLIANVFSINIYYVIPGVINFVLLMYGLYYCKNPILAIKQLDLRIKTPVFNMVN